MHLRIKSWYLIFFLSFAALSDNDQGEVIILASIITLPVLIKAYELGGTKRVLANLVLGYAIWWGVSSLQSK